MPHYMGNIDVDCGREVSTVYFMHSKVFSTIVYCQYVHILMIKYNMLVYHSYSFVLDNKPFMMKKNH